MPRTHAEPGFPLPDTHTVTNQVPPLEGYDVFTADTSLGEAVRRHGAGWARERLSELGRLGSVFRICGSLTRRGSSSIDL